MFCKKGVELGLVVHQLGVDGGGDGTGGDVVDGDVEWAEFDGEVAHEHAHAALGGAVGGEMGEDHVLVDGGDVDDAAGLFGVAKAADEGLGEEEGALEVDVEDGVVVGFGDVPEVGALLDAGVVDEDVAAAELCVGLVDEVLRVGEVGDVGLDEDGFAPAASALAAFPVPARRGCDSRRRRLHLPGEANGDGLADARAGTGDDCYFAWRRPDMDGSYLLVVFLRATLLGPSFLREFSLWDSLRGSSKLSLQRILRLAFRILVLFWR